MAYPDWVLKHKKKGTYINKVGNNYYLYAAHSEHIPGTTNKARRICDGYLGKITESDGFIPKKPKPSPTVLEYGLSCSIVSLCATIFSRIEQDHPDSFKEIIIRSILLFIYGHDHARLQHLSFISSFLGQDLREDEPTVFLIQRTALMINSTLSKLFSDPSDLAFFITLTRSIQIVKINKDWVISLINRDAKELITSLHIQFEEDPLWKKLIK